ncbi:MAG: dephospho-CoA kinase [Candidatus Melainabacteria bacterium]|nr:dephospho-CoA kinase [Candidatus Melainabacteria bacterium]
MTQSSVSASAGGIKVGKRAKPYRIGITGGIACGKSAVGKYLSGKGIPVIDTDHLGHELLGSPNPAYQKLLDRFGTDLVDKPGGPISREKLAKIVFVDKQAKADLEAITHPAIENLLDERINSLNGEDIVVVLVPLLFECGLEPKYDEIWAVLVDHKTQVSRLKARNNLTDEQAMVRINSQWPQEKKAARSHRIIDNSGTLDETYRQTEACLSKAYAEATKNSLTPQPADPARDAEYKEILKRFAAMATSEVLDRMGDVSSTQHKAAEAQLQMSVSSCQAGVPDADEHQLKVKLAMCVRNTKGTGNTPSPITGSCSCKCNNNCRNGCACAANCGCSCKGPCQPPKPPPPPANTLCHAHHCHPGLLTFFCLLAILLAAGVCWFHHSNEPPKPCGTSGVTCSPDPLKNRPILVLTDEQFEKLFCKSRCSEPKLPTCAGTSCPPQQPPATTPQCTCCQYQSPSPTPPSFILAYLHNQVRFRTTQWTVRCRQNELGATVVGRDERGRLTNWMEFGPDLTFTQQWIINYLPGNVQVEVVLFAAPNNFVGRTAYQYDNWGRLALVKRLDNGQRPLTAATFERSSDGSLNRVVVRRFNTDGLVVDVLVSWYHPNITLMIDEFYQYELFGQFK